jgi:hypothetical protein
VRRATWAQGRGLWPQFPLDSSAWVTWPECRLIEIWRNDFKIDAQRVRLELPPQEEIDKWKDTRALWQAQYHMGFWLACIPTRKKPNADVEIGHRSVTVCHLANLARRLHRKLKWDPKEQQIIGDKEANMLATNRPRRKGWELPKI